MKILNPKFNRKDPLNPLLRSKANDYNLRSSSPNKYSYELGSSNQNSSYFKNTFNNSSNKIGSARLISNLSDIMNENKKTSHTNNNITISSDNLFACLNNNTNRAQKSVSMPKKKKVRFPNDENFVQIILVESHKNFHKIDNIYDDNQKDIDKIKILKSETINKRMCEENKKRGVSPIKCKQESSRDNRKQFKDNLNKNSKPYNDKACKCMIF